MMAFSSLGHQPQRAGRVTVLSPRVIFSDRFSDRALLFMSDAGDLPKLKDWLRSDELKALESAQRMQLVKDVGTATGAYLKAFHQACESGPQRDSSLANRSAQRLAKSVSGIFGHLHHSDTFPY